GVGGGDHAGQREDARADDGADTEHDERERAKRAPQLVPRLRFREDAFERLGSEQAHGKPPCPSDSSTSAGARILHEESENGGLKPPPQKKRKKTDPRPPPKRAATETSQRSRA